MADRDFYSFDDIISTIQTSIANSAKGLSDFTSNSGVGSIINAVAHFIEFMQLQINIAFESFYLKTAKGTNLNLRVQDWNITRRTATAASGTIVFTSNTAASDDFIIPQGTTVATQPDVFDSIIEYTTDADILFAEDTTSASGIVTCISTGVIGNQPADSITNIPTSISGVDSITNPSALTNGVEEETDEDLKKRVPLVINGMKASNLSAIKAAALAISGISVVRVDQGVGTGIITIYVASQTGELTAEQLTEVTAAIEDQVAFGIDVVVLAPTVQYVQITMAVTYKRDIFQVDADGIPTTLDGQIRAAIYSFVSSNASTYLYLSDIITVVKKIPGVLNVKSVTIDGVSDDLSVDSFSVIRLASSSSANITATYTGA